MDLISCFLSVYCCATRPSSSICRCLEISSIKLFRFASSYRKFVCDIETSLLSRSSSFLSKVYRLLLLVPTFSMNGHYLQIVGVSFLDIEIINSNEVTIIFKEKVLKISKSLTYDNMLKFTEQILPGVSTSIISLICQKCIFLHICCFIILLNVLHK